MLQYIIRRLLLMIPTFIGATLLVFVILQLAPDGPFERAVRELKEETGLTPIRMFIADHVSTFYEKNGDLINLVPVFGIETETKRITLSSEHSEYKWMDFF